MKYLAIDYGLKHIGLATSEGHLAEPLSQLKNEGDQLLAGKIAAMCRDHHIETVVVGLSEKHMAARTQDFVKKLTSLLDIPVKTFDETLSSHTASEYLVQSGAKRTKRQQKQHQTAAAVILQAYLDEKNDKI